MGGMTRPLILKKLITNTITVAGRKIFYVIETADTMNENAFIGSNHFLWSAFLFKNDTTYLIPDMRKKDLYKLKNFAFKNFIPPYVKARDTLFINDGNKKNFCIV